MKRYLAIGLAVVLLLSLSGAVVSCIPGKASVAGTYVPAHYPDDYLELHEDGTFHLHEMGYDATGEWEVEGNELKLYAKSGGAGAWKIPIHTVATLEIKGNKLIDPDGEAWVKK